MSKPWMKFYPADWRSDPLLRSVSIAARGLWMEMLCIMHEAEPYGHLMIGNSAVAEETLARLAGIGLKECRRLLSTLREVGVCSETADGVLYSRRMVSDHAKSLLDKDNGSKGGNPALKRGVNPPDKAQKPEARNQKSEVEDTSTPSSNPSTEQPTEEASGKGVLLDFAKGREKARARMAEAADADLLGDVPSKYAFEYGVIRLSKQHYDRWRKAFPRINLDAFLISKADWAENEPDWFFILPKVLARLDREAAAEEVRYKAEAEAKAAQPKSQACGYVC